MGSRLPSSDWLVTAGAFVGTNPEDELITFGLPVSNALSFVFTASTLNDF